MKRKEIEGYLDAQGRVTQIPSKKKKKLFIFSYIADQIPEDTTYTEREFSQLLNELHTFKDAATLRRELYDYYLINKEHDGSLYQVNKNRLSAEELVEKYC